MKERPILFSGAMVRALLDGSKTQTRRIVKPQPGNCDHSDYGNGALALEGKFVRNGDEWYCPTCGNGIHIKRNDVSGMKCPYGTPGDRLYVHETHEVNRIGYEEDGSGLRRHHAGVAYKANDGREQFPISVFQYEAFDAKESRGWTPSIHMPRWASRITLEIIDVRVERLQEISETDAVAEGIRQHDQKNGWVNECTLADGKRHFDASAYGMFQQLWADINGAESWNSNPWVWVVEFKRVTS